MNANRPFSAGASVSSMEEHRNRVLLRVPPGASRDMGRGQHIKWKIFYTCKSEIYKGELKTDPHGLFISKKKFESLKTV